MKIHFYIPENFLPHEEEREQWMTGTPSRLSQSGKAACVQCWIYLTYIRLTQAGVAVELCHKIPEDGIVVALTGNLMPNFRPHPKVFLIGVVADGTPHPACHHHILQNATHATRLPHSTYIPLWSQPGLIPRNSARGERFKNIYFFGDPPNLAPELRDSSFAEILKNRFGLNLVLAEAERWHDYSEADCVLAIRELSSRLFLRKPATKLYNAWLAGVPLIGGMESAFRAHGKTGIDYISCKTLDDMFQALIKLRDNPSLRRQIAAEGKISALKFTPEAITRCWIEFLESVSTKEASAHFSQSPHQRKFTSWRQRLTLTFDKLRGGY